MGLISKPDAEKQGLKRYFTGKQCKRGHLAERFVSTSQCTECLNAHNRQWKHANLEKCNVTKRKWNAANREKMREIKNAWNRANPEGQKLRARKWYLANREKANESTYKWRKANLETAAAAQTRRRAKLLKCLPPWADHDKIHEFYAKAKELTAKTGVPHHVDHIIPLQGKTVSGLHVETNLQVLPGVVNQSKGNLLLAA